MTVQDIVNEALVHGADFMETAHTLNELRFMYNMLTDGNFMSSGKKHDIANAICHYIRSQNRAWAFNRVGPVPYCVCTPCVSMLREAMKDSTVEWLIDLTPDIMVDRACSELFPNKHFKTKYQKLTEMKRLFDLERGT